MSQQVIPRSFLWLVSIWTAFIIGIIGCGDDDDDNQWVGTWEMESINGQSLEEFAGADFGAEGVTVSIVTNNWTFNDDGTMEAELTLKAEVTEGSTKFSLQSSVKTAGTYSLSGSNYTLTITTEEGGGLFGEGDGTEEDTGTWSRSGNTLTLNNNEGETVVFKKK